MKNLLTFLFFLLSFAVTGQISISIVPTDAKVCFNDSVAFEAVLTGSATGTISYQWQRNMSKLPGQTDSLLIIPHVKDKDAGLYRCILMINGYGVDTSNTAILSINPKMVIDTLYRSNQLGCPGDCKGQFRVNVSGGTPFSSFPDYIYNWNGGKSGDTIVFGLCPGNYRLMITDSLGCVMDTAYFVDALKSPEVPITFSPKDTIYLSNPTITVAFSDTMRNHINNWIWDYNDSTRVTNENPSTHIYDRSGPRNVKLTFTDKNGCLDSTVKILTVKIANLEIPNVFTPNGDRINDRFEVLLKGEPKTKDYREAYLQTDLYIYDRWGRRVFGRSGYQSGDWDGENCSDGTYYYVLKCTGYWSDDVYRGSLQILRGNNN